MKKENLLNLEYKETSNGEDWENEVFLIMNGRGITAMDLKRDFERVEDSKHWKNPICARITLEDDWHRDRMELAIIHFTGSTPKFVKMDDGMWVVTANGYYEAVGA
jgi:hypothetical protein